MLLLLQTLVLPVIAPGVAGAVLTVKVEALVTVHPAAVVTTILPVPVAPAGSGTVICPLFTKVTGVADTPLIVTVVVPDTKLDPLIVITEPLPLHALVGLKLVIVGAVHVGVVVPSISTFPIYSLSVFTLNAKPYNLMVKVPPAGTLTPVPPLSECDIRVPRVQSPSSPILSDILS